MEKRGQAAMEFLMTYGWAILAAIVVIGVLAYFGVFSPGKYMPEACLINAPFNCDESAASAASGISLVIRNGGGDTMSVSDVTVSDCGSYTTATDIADGETATIVVACTPALTEGNKFKGDISITYRISGGALDQTSTGSITKKVAA